MSFSRSLQTESQFLKGVGPRFAAAMAKAGLLTVRDVLWYFPRRYEDRRNIPGIRDVRPGQWITVRGRITEFEGRPSRRGGMVLIKATLSDKTGSIDLTWFNQPWVRRSLEGYRGEIVAYGQAKEARWGCEINTPEWEKIDEEADPQEFARITPVYPLVDGLSQMTVRKATRAAVEGYLDMIDEPLPSWMRKRYDLGNLVASLRSIHMPESDETRAQARKRLVFDEFFFMQMALALKRHETAEELGISFPIAELEAAAPLPDRASESREEWDPAARNVPDSPGTLFEELHRESRAAEPLWQQIGRMLPFDLTGAQDRVIREVFSDMARRHPMNRLVQGDVGSGKTAVAACAMLAAVRSGFQTALMAPTEILAEQHHANLRRLFEPLGIEVALLVGKLSAAEKRKAAERVAAGDVHVAIGTHALIQEGVRFARLGLAVIDEQHRFGVLQRAALRGKGVGNPDVLVMTATPIPRTLTMAVYGDLDLSVIDELPPGRKPVRTHWKPPYDRPQVYQGVRELLGQTRQAYFVCPMVGESEKMLAQAAEDLHYRLTHEVYPDLRVGLLHGQLKAKEKEEVMESFRRHELDILVSTTVIEVGVDVPNASVMVVEDANRFGLSQLHQLRGRVGRGAHQSYCILIADAKNDDARARMEIMVATNDGFRIAEEDLRLRGPGELAGTKQSGNLDFKIADLVQDGKMLEVARQAAFELVNVDPTLERPEHATILARVRQQRAEAAILTVS